MLVPELELVASFVGTRFNNRQQFEPLQLMLQRILPAFRRPTAAQWPAPHPVESSP